MRNTVNKVVRTVFLITFTILAIGRNAQAKPIRPPLYLLLGRDQSATSEPYAVATYSGGGDLWKWMGDSQDNSLIRITHWTFNSPPVVSPNGRYLAYRSLTQGAINYLNSEDANYAGRLQDATLPVNIWLMDTTSNEAHRITDDNSRNGLARSMPAWSPNGQKIAWIEADSIAANHGYSENFDPTQFIPHLMVYDLATGKTQMAAVRIPLPNYGDPGTGGTTVGHMIPMWGKPGIFVSYSGNTVIFDLFGNQLFELGKDRDNALFRWITDGPQTYFGTKVDSSKPWELYNVKTGEQVPYEGHIEQYSPLAPSGFSLRVRVNEYSYWELVTPAPSATTLELCGSAFVDIESTLLAISPDGQLVACTDGGYWTDDVVIYGAGGIITRIPLHDKTLMGLTWGPIAWRIAR
jgi:hypothetical protein